MQSHSISTGLRPAACGGDAQSPARLLSIVMIAGCCVTAAFGADSKVNFESQIAPILQQHCVRCHSPGNEKGEISLATVDDLSEQGYLVAGDPDSSYLWQLVSWSDGEPPQMPKDAKPLGDAELQLVRQWIIEGAMWPPDVVVRQATKATASWWSLQPLPSLTSFKAESVAEAAEIVDGFICAKLTDNGLTMNPPADRRKLIRRATYDLIGLPPTPEEVNEFVADPDPRAYERLIDRLLESPHYGERWGRHWLDVVRFGESNGFERNVIINSLWPFRDYVIRSLNADKPFDQFIREHIAGDVMSPDDPQVAVGTAFLVAGPYDDVGNEDAVQAAQIRANTLDEIIGATSQAFLGLTVGCARCHDHKFDPITQHDYYSLYATFAGIRHGEVPLATPAEQAARSQQLAPLTQRRSELEQSLHRLRANVLERARGHLAEYQANWRRPPADRRGTEERFAPVVAKFVRLVCEAQDVDPSSSTGFRIDEFEIWSAESPSQNVALASRGARATGQAREIEDFPGAYGAHLVIDGKPGALFVSIGTDLTVELSRPTRVDRVVFSSARGEEAPGHPTFTFVADYRIEVSLDGQNWQLVTDSHDRRPRNELHRDHRLLQLEMSADERAEQARLQSELADVQRSIAGVPQLPVVWIGTRSAEDARGPFHVFLGGSPQRQGAQVQPSSPSVFDAVAPGYRLPPDSDEGSRRRQLAMWITHPQNPLTARVLANRVWHYHFGTGIVDTPSDFGYMGGRPTHPQLLDFLAIQLQSHGWRLKRLHRVIMSTQTYQQSSKFRAQAAELDGASRLLWRFPPRRLSAEEIRDTMLFLAGHLRRMSAIAADGPEIVASDGQVARQPDGGPGFRLYHFMQDNVCTYEPLDRLGPETYRRAVYHQNVRASVVDLMTDFDQPDCAFSAPRRAQTTTPLQALTMLNHDFTLAMARDFAERLEREAGDNVEEQIRFAYRVCYSRAPTEDELRSCRDLVHAYSMPALCRVLLNTSELIYLN